MKILLTTLNSKYVHSNPALKYLYRAGISHCEPGGLEIREFTINNSRDMIFTELVRQPFDLVCFSCYIWNRDRTLELAEDLKKALPETGILLGGPEVSFETEEFLRQYSFVDFVLSGEGEAGFAELCKTVGAANSWEQVQPEKISNLTYRTEDGRIRVNPQAALLPFEEIPFPYETFPCEEDKVIYYESSRGCPYRCSYCISSLDKTVRALPPARVKRDLALFIGRKVKQVKFLDRTFNWEKQRSMEIFRYLIDNDNGTTNFHFELCGDLLDREMLELLSRARKGLFQFEIGIQSTNRETLKAVNRSADTAGLIEKVKSLAALGNSHVHTDLIAGLPFEDYESFRNSFNQVYAIGADDLQLGFLKMLRGTGLRAAADAQQYRYQYQSRAPYEVISSQWITGGELCRLKQIEHVLSLYHNREGFQNSLIYAIDTYAETPFDFYQDFASFFYEKGYQLRSHRKEDLYRIFFAYTHDRGADPKMDRLLESDLEASMNFDAVKKFKRKGWQLSL